MIHFVGAGPGAADLITVRGARLLAAADMVVYAGSLVNRELLDLCRPDCALHDSATLTLEEIVALMRTCDERDQDCVRLQTGDTALFGALREQMDALDALGIAYDVTPGVSSLFGASAALRLEYTVPGVAQSLIVTRAEGRTPIPAGEELRALAAHGCTMALFLSAGMLEQVERELLAGAYVPDTPAALVYRASWADEQVVRCTVGTLAASAREQGITRQALVVVGDVLAESGERSKLYDPGFAHGYRLAGGTHAD